MDLYEFLDTVKLPIKVKNEDYKTVLYKQLNQIKITLKKNYTNIIPDRDMTIRTDISNLCNCINSVVELYYRGKIKEAYYIFEVGMDGIKSHFNELEYNLFTNESMFRCRTSSNYELEAKEMFHIPFEKRRRIKTQRYSIPGFPCLYTGTSTLICWEELGRPDLNSTQFSTLLFTENDNKVLNFSFTPQSMANLYKSFKIGTEQVILDKFYNAYLRCLPLIVASSISIKDDDDSFKPEYIIPQFILQWINNQNNYIGVKYFSTRIEPDTLSDSRIYLYQNYAFPVQSDNNEGLCEELKKKFKITEPVPYQIYSAFSTGLHSIDEKPKFKSRREYELRDRRVSLGIDYMDTAFGKLEDYLRHFEPKPIV